MYTLLGFDNTKISHEQRMVCVCMYICRITELISWSVYVWMRFLGTNFLLQFSDDLFVLVVWALHVHVHVYVHVLHVCVCVLLQDSH